MTTALWPDGEDVPDCESPSNKGPTLLPEPTISSCVELKAARAGGAYLSAMRMFLGWLVLSMLSASIPAVGPISPGPLPAAHRSLDGATGCTPCHKLSTGEPTFKCLDCHSEIASRVAAAQATPAP